MSTPVSARQAHGGAGKADSMSQPSPQKVRRTRTKLSTPSKAAKANAKSPAKPGRSQEEADREAVVLTLCGLSGFEDAVCQLMELPEPSGYEPSTLAKARCGLEKIRAECAEALGRRQAPLELAKAERDLQNIGKKKADLQNLFDHRLRPMLEGACGDQAVFDETLQRLQAAVASRGAPDWLLEMLPDALAKNMDLRSEREKQAVERMLLDLEDLARDTENQVKEAELRVRNAEDTCGKVPAEEDMSVLLCRQALDEEALRQAEANLAALDRLSKCA